MMKKCPLMSFHFNGIHPTECLGEQCAMAADEAGNCLIQQALSLLVADRRTELATENEELRQARLFNMAEALIKYEKNKIQ